MSVQAVEASDVNVLHHLGIIARNMAGAIAQYERLGFMFAPLTLPRTPLEPGGDPRPIGVGNRCAIFENNYLEFLGTVDPVLWASITKEQRGPFDIDEPLRRYEGLHVLHFGTEDLESVRGRLLSVGLEPSAIRPFQRLIDTEDGAKMMRAKALSFPHGTNPEALLQIAQHETPELVMQPRYMRHLNGAKSITEVIVCSEVPEILMRKYELYSGKSAYLHTNVRVLDLGLSRIIVVDPRHLGDVLPGQIVPTTPFLAGFTLSSDVLSTKDYLQGAGVAFRAFEDRLIVDASDGHGAAVLFEAVGSGR